MLNKAFFAALPRKRTDPYQLIKKRGKDCGGRHVAGLRGRRLRPATLMKGPFIDMGRTVFKKIVGSEESGRKRDNGLPR